MQRTDHRLNQNDCQGHYAVPGISLSRLAVALMGLLFLIASISVPASGQAAATLVVSTPQTTAFPEVSVEFKLSDSTGHPIRNLAASQLTVIEDGTELSVSSVSESYRGINFVLVINGNREMDIRNASGISRYEKMTDALQGWAANRHFSGDDSWSLMTNSGLEVGDASEAETWITALGAYQPNFRQLEQELTSLQESIQMLQRTETSFGVDKSLLYITPPPTPDQIAGINALAEQARQAGIQVNVWMVGDAYYLTNDQGGVLVEIAATTGGQFFYYSGTETLPDLNDALNDLGYAAELTYESAIRETGSYPLTIRAMLGDLEVSGESLPFYVDVQPPNPMLLAPPVSITLQPFSNEGTDEIVYEPVSLDLHILVEFPDSKPRALTVSRLLVDGSVVDVNAEAPFDAFTWDFSRLTESGEHTIQVEVEDELGLSGTTLLTPVQVTVLGKGMGGNWSLQQIGLVASGLVVGAGLVLLGLWASRKFLRANSLRWRNRRGEIGSEQAGKVQDEEPGDAEQFALLIPLDSFDETGLVITKKRVLVGSDPQQVNLVVSGAGVEPLHAELTLDEEGFWLRQFCSSGSFTRLNYQPVGIDQVRVKPGDLLHFGECGFRFTIEENESEKQISVTRYEPYL